MAGEASVSLPGIVRCTSATAIGDCEITRSLLTGPGGLKDTPSPRGTVTGGESRHADLGERSTFTGAEGVVPRAGQSAVQAPPSSLKRE